MLRASALVLLVLAALLHGVAGANLTLESLASSVAGTTVETMRQEAGRRARTDSGEQGVRARLVEDALARADGVERRRAGQDGALLGLALVLLAALEGVAAAFLASRLLLTTVLAIGVVAVGGSVGLLAVSGPPLAAAAGVAAGLVTVVAAWRGHEVGEP